MTLEILNKLSRIVPVSTDWVAETDARGRKVAKYRRYQAGEHDQKLSENMRKLLRIEDQDSEKSLTMNYMDVVIQTMADRVILQTVEADNKQASDWAQEVLDHNRYDALQAEVHEAAIRDGDSFLMVSWEEDQDDPEYAKAGGAVRLTFEEAWDGKTGVIPVYKSRNAREMVFCLKIWQEDDWKNNATAILTRINVYYPDRVEKYFIRGMGEIQEWTGTETKPEQPVQEWTYRNGEPIGIPVIHFRNAGRQNFGRSEISTVIGVQDALNRSFYSLIIASELTGFPIYKALGFDPPQSITPGAIVAVGKEGLQDGETADFDMVNSGDLSQLGLVVDKFTTKIGTITRTPAPEFGMPGAADTASGEALKQREIGLIGKANRLMSRAGNAWEDALKLASHVQDAWGKQKAPTYQRFYSRWHPAEIRNDTQIVDNALKLRELFGDKQTLRAVATVYEFDEKQISDILKERDKMAKDKLRAMLPQRFGGTNNPPPLNADQFGGSNNDSNSTNGTNGTDVRTGEQANGSQRTQRTNGQANGQPANG